MVSVTTYWHLHSSQFELYEISIVVGQEWLQIGSFIWLTPKWTRNTPSAFMYHLIGFSQLYKVDSHLRKLRLRELYDTVSACLLSPYLSEGSVTDQSHSLPGIYTPRGNPQPTGGWGW